MKRPLVAVCATDREATALAQDLRFFWNGGAAPVIYFPSYRVSPYKPLSYSPETSCRRIEALYRMLTASNPVVVVTTVSGLLQKVIPRQALSRCCDYVVTGEDTDRDDLVARLIQAGYQEAALVEEPGDYAVRGGLIDVFAPLYPDPVRIEFFGDTVESIRTFSAQDQLSRGSLDELTLLPVRETVLEAPAIDDIVTRVRARGRRLEMPGLRLEQIVDQLQRFSQLPGIGGLLSLIFPSPETLFDYLPEGVLPVLVDPAALKKQAADLEAQLTQGYLSTAGQGGLCVEPETLYLTWPEVEAFLEPRTHLAVTLIGVTDGSGPACDFAVQDNALLAQALKARKDAEGLLRPLAEWVGDCRAEGLAVYLLCRTARQARRLDELLRPYGIGPGILEGFDGGTAAKQVPCICLGHLSSGFVWPQEGLAIVTQDEIFGRSVRPAPASRPKPQAAKLAFEDLTSGDLVVHVDHGIGRYEGLVTLNVGGMTNDFLLLEYRDGDKLYVPVERMGCVQKYIGVDGITPSLDKMGGSSWQRVKARVKKSIRKIAGDLLRLYAWRKAQKGHAFSAPDRHFREFEAAFAYTETPDQRRAVEEVLADMESPVPMDRLICGDVGYGKTEIAVRAAFKAVWDGKQVAFLVPTTVLAEQHCQTFKKRFEPYPVEIATLSRFRSPGRQREVVDQLKQGRIDIVIGTHRLLQKDISFRDLGLLIIDEEQRFGVAHKEKLKTLRRTVDVLALTATPIPRTLHMSLMGIRDLSVISTPPEYRYPIKTYICPVDDMVIAEAVHAEMQRGGQVFFVHNNIETIWAMARRIQGLVPGIRIGVAHGRLADEELEKVMLRFLHREIDLLVCTTIIESGLDFPSANTILINRADKFGLAQIYQLRGRVGRGDEQAYAYLFIPHESALTQDARKRLKVLMEHSDLGSGFQIAMSDLQIRGGGTILGPTQSGQIASIGHEMYLKLIERTVKELKGEPVEPEIEPEITAGVTAYIPEDYVSHIDQRMTLYRRLARVADERDLREIREELMDRFGPFPEAVQALLAKIELRIWCKQLGIERLELGVHDMVLSFSESTTVTPEKIMHLIQGSPHRFRMSSDHVLRARTEPDADGSVLGSAKKVLQALAA
ncbi:MAG: transcription-repair coupling factor [Deltaproteobacteria bacterium]|nr:transcription-repair coupling factor [Deltaproteobacteria bacterium]